MKKLALVSALVAVFIGNATAADKTASAIATWDATAAKDTKSALVVTPLKSLEFNYAAQTQAFNQVNGQFSIEIEGQDGATDFKLESKIVSNTLSRAMDESELTVGVSWNGTKLATDTATTLIDTSVADSAHFGNLVAGYNKAGRIEDRGAFNFTIDSATVAAAETPFADLADGYWDGEVSVEFTATWTGTVI